MVVSDPKATARDAARIFAETYWDEPRKIGLVLNAPGVPIGQGIQFNLVDGKAWYIVKMLPDYSGWEVTRE